VQTNIFTMKLRGTLFIKQIVLLRIQPLYGSTPCFAYPISRLILFCVILKSNPKSNYMLWVCRIFPHVARHVVCLQSYRPTETVWCNRFTQQNPKPKLVSVYAKSITA